MDVEFIEVETLGVCGYTAARWSMHGLGSTDWTAPFFSWLNTLTELVFSFVDGLACTV